MNALAYLLLTSFKNRILSLKKKPIYLVLYGILAIGVVLMIVAMAMSENSNMEKRPLADIRILYLILVGVVAFFFILFAMSGLEKGASMFSMADVGLLFVAPVSPKKILIYGLVKQMGTTFLSSIFLLYQIANLKTNFNVGGKEILGLMVIYSIVLFFSQLLSMTIYILTNGNKERKRLVKIALILLSVFMVLCVLYFYYIVRLDWWSSIKSITTFLPFQLIPVIGWSSLFFEGIVIGSFIKIVTSLVLFLIFTFVFVTIVARQEGDYYEDVLGITQITYETRLNAKQGKLVNARKVKIKEEQTGIKKGRGANTIFYRHLLEKKRTSRFLFLDFYTVATVTGAVILGIFVKGVYSGYIVMGALLYIQLFMTMFSKLAFELQKPYIYLMPAKSIHKVIAVSAFTFLKAIFDGVLIFFPLYLLTEISFMESVFLVLSYGASSAVYICYGIILTRLLGTDPDKMISSILRVVFIFALFMPPIGVSIAAYFILPAGLKMLTTLPFIFVCVVIIIFTFITCGDIFDKAEFGK